MYCPKCNQQQASDEMRFCSRCGFPLSGVAQLLANDGLLPEAADQGATAASRRRKIISESAFLTLIAWAMTFGAILFVDFGGPFEVFALISAIVFFIVGLIGLIRFIYGFFFVKDSPKAEKQPRDRSIPAPVAQSALPPAHSIPVTDYARRVHTKEIVQPPSITENTTKLLDENISDRSE